MANRWGKKRNSDRIFSWRPKSLWTVTAAVKLKKPLLLGRKALTNLDSILKSRDITLLTKVHIVKAMVFPVVMYGYENWTIQLAMLSNCGCWRRLLTVPWTASRLNQSILKEINPEYHWKD